MTDAQWYAKLESLERRMAAFHAVQRGELQLVRVWREGYREKKIREVSGHYIRLVKPLDWKSRRKRRR